MTDQSSPPIAERRPHSFTRHGITVDDPWAWLRDPGYPEVEDKDVLDAALINAAQAVEHYEITRYGTLIAWARQLGRNDGASVLQQTLAEEKKTDEKLTNLAEMRINLKAAE